MIPSLYWGGHGPHDDDDAVARHEEEADDGLTSPSGIFVSRAPPSCLRNNASTQGGEVATTTPGVTVSGGFEKVLKFSGAEKDAVVAPSSLTARHFSPSPAEKNRKNKTAHHPQRRPAVLPRAPPPPPPAPPRRLAALCRRAALVADSCRPNNHDRLWHDAGRDRRLWPPAARVPAAAAQGAAAARAL